MNQPAAPDTETFLDKFTVIFSATRELWLTFLLKFLICAAYEVTALSLVRWLQAEYHWGDISTQHMILTWGLTMTVTTLLVGSLTDALGLRRTFFLGAWICLFARAIMAFSNLGVWFALIAGLLPLAVGEALGTPVLIAATRKYSTTAQRSISFSIIYAVMNLGFWVGNDVFDWVRDALGEKGHWTLPLVGWEMTTYRTMFLISLAVELVVLATIFFLREGVEVGDEGIHVVPARQFADPSAPLAQRAWETIRASAGDTARFLNELIHQPGFYRLLAFLLLISCLKLVYSVMMYVFPTWGIRVLGEKAAVGHLLSINNFLIFFIVPVVGALTSRFSAYRMVILGGFIVAASVFIMTLPTGLFRSAADHSPGAWLGHYLGLQGAINPYYIMIALFIITYSFGEAFYSPRVYEYAAAIAPKGQEASYGSLSYIPLLFGKIITGTTGGILLATYCPEQGERHSGVMWLYFALAATIAPVGLILLQRLIRVHEAGRPGDAPPAS